jgi:hypothetical protein
MSAAVQQYLRNIEMSGTYGCLKSSTAIELNWRSIDICAMLE